MCLRPVYFVRRYRGLFLTLFILLASNGYAEKQLFSSGIERNQLIQLYTSQGCSSCPPADEWLAAIKSDPQLWKRIIPIAFHVDYWNYLGWADPFAKNSHSRRQEQHHRIGNVASVYTPGFVIDGQEWRGFFRGRPAPAPSSERVGELSLTLDGEQLTANFVSLKQGADLSRHVLTVALLGVDLHTRVTAGENRGRNLEHQFVVLDSHHFMSDTGLWQGSFRFFTETTSKRYALVAWVTRAGELMPIQVLGGWVVPENLQAL